MHDYTGWWLDDGQPNQNPAKFAPTPEFADSERPLRWGPPAQQAERPACSTPLEAGAAGQGALMAGQGAPAAGQDAPAAGQGAPAAGQGAPAAGLKFKHLVKTLATTMICLVRSLRSDVIGPEVLHRCTLLPCCIMEYWRVLTVGKESGLAAGISSCLRRLQHMKKHIVGQGLQQRPCYPCALCFMPCRGFIDLVLAGALELAKAVKPKSDEHNPYMKAESALAGSMAWGKVDYMLVYRSIGILVVEVSRQMGRSSSRTMGRRSTRILAEAAVT